MINTQHRWSAAGDLGQRGATARRHWSLPDGAPRRPSYATPAPSPSRKSHRLRRRRRRRAARSGATGMILVVPSTLGPSVTSWSVNRLDVFARAAGQTMLHRAYNGTKWSAADDLGPAIVGGPGSRRARAGSARHLRSWCRQPALAEILERWLDGLLPARRIPHLEPQRDFVGAKSARRLRPGQRQRAVPQVVGRYRLEQRTSGSAATSKVHLLPSREGRT